MMTDALSAYLLCICWYLYEESTEPLKLHYRPRSHLNVGSWSLEQYSDVYCREHFRFIKDDLHRLAMLLRLPEMLRLEDGPQIPRMEGLCVTLYRLAYPGRFKEMKFVFQRPLRDLSRIVKKMVALVSAKWSCKMSWNDNLLLPTYLETCAQAVSRRLLQDGFSLQDQQPDIALFIDTAFRPTATTPIVAQEEVFSTRTHVHDSKFIGVCSPDGLMVALRGPYPAASGEKKALEESNILPDLREKCRGVNNRQLVAYSDKGYSQFDVIQIPHIGQLTANQREENRAMASVRMVIERSFGHTTTLFPFNDYRENLKLLLSSQVHIYYYVSTFFANLHTCFYGSECSRYFDLEPPSVEEYLS
eukprot:GILJ01011760.1.p1 GENE.GILJ01011760.1~~GILJ01011760.1.p1  ORF type:complete len:360 (-),score=12.80 GILJ01011760.1:43-1122(-)